jgi:hypothetical protein
MTLHDRIIELSKGVFAGGEYSLGYDAACEAAADIATEADKLMAEMAELLLCMNRSNCRTMEFGHDIDELIDKYSVYKDREK